MIKLIFTFFYPLLLFFFGAGINVYSAFARPASDSASTSAKRTPILLGVFVSPVFGITAPEFANEYRQISNTLFAFDSPLAIGATTKTTIGQFRVGASVEAYRARFQDNYRQNFIKLDSFGDTVRGFRGIYQDFNIKVLPVFATIEVVPVAAQFRTYAGAGIGIAYTEIFWSETINSTDPLDIRTGGVHIDETRFIPAFRLYTGMELGFDRSEGNSPLHSLFIEVRYSFISTSLPLLERVFPQVDRAPAAWKESFSVRTGGFAIAAGIALQFSR